MNSAKRQHAIPDQAERYLAKLDERPISGVDPVIATQVEYNRDKLTEAVGEEVAVWGDIVTQKHQKYELSPHQMEEIIKFLKTGFEAKENKSLCPSLNWERTERALRKTPKALWSANEMRRTGHKPAIYFADETGFDIGTLSKQPPQSTVDCVYDEDAEKWNTKNYPEEEYNGNAVAQAKAMEIELMTTEQYEHIIRNTETYDEQRWRWFKTPPEIRKKGIAIDGMRRGNVLDIDQTGVSYHHISRGWGGSLRVNFVD